MKKISKILLCLLIGVMTFNVTGCGCFGQYVITCIVEDIDYKKSVIVNSYEDNVVLPIPEYKYHKFIGYYTEEGEEVAGSLATISSKFEFDDLLTKVYGYFQPLSYSIDITTENNEKIDIVHGGEYYGADMPDLPESTREDYYLVGYATKIGETEKIISDGTTYKSGCEIFNEGCYELVEGQTVAIYPVFAREKINMTFVYNLDEEYSETISVYKNLPIDEVAPKYIDENNVEHKYGWQLKEDYAADNYNYYHGNSAENLTLYADSLLGSFKLDKHDAYAYEIYDKGSKNMNLVIPAVEASHGVLDLGLQYYVESYVENLNFTFLSSATTYSNFSIIIDEENYNLTINFDDGDKLFYGYEGKDFIGYNKEPKGDNNLTLKFSNNVQIRGGTGVKGQDAINRHYIAVGDEPSERAYNGGLAGSGGDGVYAKNLKIIVTEDVLVTFWGGDGGVGGRGGDTHHSNKNGEEFAPDAGYGSYGGTGGFGARVLGKLTIDAAGNLNFMGGNGGNGGDGGNGGNGIGGISEPDSGGDGGNGGRGGSGGTALYVKDIIDEQTQKEKIIIENLKNICFTSGRGGNGGNGGKGGDSEKATWSWHDDGSPGNGGNGGDAGAVGYIGVYSLTPFYEYGTAVTSYPNDNSYGGVGGAGGYSDGDYGIGDRGVDGKDQESKLIFLPN